ncbi:polysaccharide biosynthesis protein [Phycicoccus sp. HDW14]|nr:polysaccharide biosynthesis protein [Phycicoccus sp. HDW14]
MSRQSRGRGTVLALGWGVVDAAIWFVAVVVATWLRYQYDPDLTFVPSTYLAAGGAAGAQLLVGLVLGPYTRGTHRGSFEEVRSLATTTALVTFALFGAAVAVEAASEGGRILVPGTVPAIGGLTAYAVQLSTRLLFRTHSRRRAARRPDATRVIVVGAGSAARLLVRNLLHDERTSYLPVALLDDDRAKRRSRIEGLRVRGTREDMARVADATGAEHVVIAIPSATSQTIRELSATAEAAGLRPLVVPSLSHVIGRSLTASDIRDIDVADLLGRRPVRLDDTAISEQLNHKVVLVTGAGGSIGAELCRQIARFSPSASSSSTATSPRCTPSSSTSTARGCCRTRTSSSPTSATCRRCDGASGSTAPTSCSTRPRSSTCRSSSASPPRPGRPTSSAPSTSSRPPRRSASGPSSTSRPTRPPTPRPSSATASGSPSA